MFWPDAAPAPREDGAGDSAARPVRPSSSVSKSSPITSRNSAWRGFRGFAREPRRDERAVKSDEEVQRLPDRSAPDVQETAVAHKRSTWSLKSRRVEGDKIELGLGRVRTIVGVGS